MRIDEEMGWERMRQGEGMEMGQELTERPDRRCGSLSGRRCPCRRRTDTDPSGTSGFRALIVARARFIEDRWVEQVGRGIGQYVVLRAGLDTFAQGRPEIAAGLRVCELDRPGPQGWSGNG